VTALPTRRSPDGFVAQHLPATLHAPAGWLLTAVSARLVTLTTLTDEDVAAWPRLFDEVAM
jgi:hypothetical protein